MPITLAPPQDADPADDSAGLRLLLIAMAAAVLFHGGLLPFTHGNTYDAFIHMFFADHYHRSWFDPWEPRWYTGFAVTSYPPGTHMAIAGLMAFLPLRAAFVLVQLGGLLLLVTGVFRFALLWVPPRAAGYAAIAAVLASSISETVHLFGQLPTICSLGIFLNGLPYVYRWIVHGGWRSCLAAVTFSAATTAAHHVTTIFGGVLFILPLGVHALVATAALRPATGRARFLRFAPPLARGAILAVLMIGAIVLTVFPYWYWSVTDPITQVSIPHGSRESFLERLDLGIVFFVIPWGVAILFLPYAIYKTATTRLWPLGLSLLLCVLLGTGGTTPLPRAILGGAFDILTLDRFTFWATILILPFLGLMFDGLLHGRSRLVIGEAFGKGTHRLIVGAIFAAFTGMAVLPAVLPTLQPTQPVFVDPAPIARFMAEDEHHRWRYLTLGLGDQFAYLSAMTPALSVDGNYHSARRLPDLTRFSVERLENAKYLGVPGLGSLRQFLVNAERYNLKYVFSNDAFYDPLLHFTGWTRLNRLTNGIVVWEKPDIPPLPLVLPRRDIPALHVLMWGTLPPAALVAAGLIFLASALQRTLGARPGEFRPVAPAPLCYTNPRRVRQIVFGLALLVMMATTALLWTLRSQLTRADTPEDVITAYFDDLDFRRHDAAYARLDPGTRGSLEVAQFAWRWTGGLIASYGKLSAITVKPLGQQEAIADFAVSLDWLTPLKIVRQELTIRTVRRDGQWFVAPTALRPVQTPLLLQRQEVLDLNVTGRRQPRPETDLHRDRLDRPRIAVSGARLVRHAGRFAVVGQITNADADPAHISLAAELFGPTLALGREAAGTVASHRLLPAESAGFRVDFEGVLSLQDARAEYDPTLFIPPEFAEAPATATLDARALVTGSDLYRGVSLNGIRAEVKNGALLLTGLAVNTGTETASITGLTLLLYGPDGLPLWAEAAYVETNIYPGQSAPFAVTLPLGSEITVLADLAPSAFTANGRTQEPDLTPPDASQGTIPLDPATGYTHLRILAASMTHDPLF
ncbi:hypothetical protein [Tabrizicola sp.]|uniref:hypothetical protein n=1 Tax=Tabrizicola sp. TaxID=2005166 RepID=UPI0025FDF0F5|nr:hypothetical protein [Tabrizicola sp.]